MDRIESPLERWSFDKQDDKTSRSKTSSFVSDKVLRWNYSANQPHLAKYAQFSIGLATERKQRRDPEFEDDDEAPKRWSASTSRCRHFCHLLMAHAYALLLLGFCTYGCIFTKLSASIFYAEFGFKERCRLSTAQREGWEGIDPRRSSFWISRRRVSFTDRCLTSTQLSRTITVTLHFIFSTTTMRFLYLSHHALFTLKSFVSDSARAKRQKQ
jgi:hypothetical protein